MTIVKTNVLVSFKRNDTKLFFFFFFFLTCPHKRGERGIRTSDLHFIKCDPSRLNYLHFFFFFLLG
jgi:hypothetical protein